MIVKGIWPLREPVKSSKETEISEYWIVTSTSWVGYGGLMCFQYYREAIERCIERKIRVRLCIFHHGMLGPEEEALKRFTQSFESAVLNRDLVIVYKAKNLKAQLLKIPVIGIEVMVFTIKSWVESRVFVGLPVAVCDERFDPRDCEMQVLRIEYEPGTAQEFAGTVMKLCFEPI
jgi:hypothetical protein